MAGISIDDEVLDEHLKGLVVKTIFEGLTPEKRDELITTAVANLLSPSEYDRGKSKVQEIFAQAVYGVARDIAKEHLQTQEVKDRIKELVELATNKALALTEIHENGKGEKENALVGKIAEAIEKAIVGDRY